MAGENAELLLSEAADLLTGFPFTSESYSDGSDDIRLLRGDNVIQGRIRWDGVKRWPVSRVASLEQYLLQPGDVVVAMDRPWIDAGLKYATLTEEDSPSLLVQRVARLRAKEGVSQRFLGYIIGSRKFTDYVLGIQTGTAVPHISPSAIKRFRFRCPPLDQQDRIARLLGIFDEKIDNNRQMSRTLEEIARSLFRSWFVDFNPVRRAAAGEDTGLTPHTTALFPKRLGEDGLPEGWRGGSVSDYADINPQTKLSFEYAAPYVDMAALPTNGPRISAYQMRVPGSGARFKNGDTLIARITPCLENGKSALVDLLPHAAVGWGSTEFIVLRPHSYIPRALPYIVARHASFRAHLIAAMSGTSGRQRVQAAAVDRWRLAVPSREVIDAFAQLVNPIFDRLRHLGDENDELATLRDTLLPKLISGELRIRHAEKVAENA